MKAFRLALARKMFELGLWKLGRYVLRDGDVLFLDAGATLSSVMKAASRPARGHGSKRTLYAPACQLGVVQFFNVLCDRRQVRI